MRSWLSVWLSVIVVSFAITSVRAQLLPRKRKSINEVTPTELSNYIHALDVLRERSKSNSADQSGYDFQAALHNDQFVGPCEHGNDLFFAWHRAHLYYFELLLQQSDPPRTSEVTIPYWDWIHSETDGGRYPKAFSKGGLDSPGRLIDGVSLPADTLDIVKIEPNWNEFGGYPKGTSNRNYGRFERGPHNFMHGEFISGKMGDPSTAAEDPIYFSFHCFIDLMWSEWQRRNGAPPPTSLDSSLRGFTSQPKNLVKNFQSIAALGYEYEYSAALKKDFGVSQSVPKPGELMQERSIGRLTEEIKKDSIRKNSKVEIEVPTTTRSASRVLISLNDISVPATRSYTMRLYLHPRNAPFNHNDEAFTKQYYVGYLTMWRSHKPAATVAGEAPPHAHHPATCNATFDVTTALSKAAAEKLDNLVLTVHITPAPDAAGKRDLNDELIKEIDFEDVKLEYYK